jgi:hypothetical protein
MDPFPRSMRLFWQAKILDEKPNIPLEFPAALKNLISDGWSKNPRKRPEIEKFKTALSSMLEQNEDASLAGNKKDSFIGHAIFIIYLIKYHH